MSREVISGWQATILIVLSNVPTAVFFIPTLMISLTEQDAWISVIISVFLAGTFIFYPIADLGRRYPGKTAIEYSEEILGKYLGKVFGLIFIYHFFQNHCWSVREFAIIAEVVLSEAYIPLSIIVSLVIIYAVYNGLEVIARCGEFLFPIGIAILLFLLISNYINFDITNLFPIFETDISTLILASMHPLDWLGIGFVFCMLTGFLKNGASSFRVGFASLTISGGIFTIFTIANIIVFGASALKITSWPLFELARYSIVPVVERGEIFVIVLWIAWVFIKGAIFSYVTLLSIAQVFKLKDYKFLIAIESIFAIFYSTYQYQSFVKLSYLFKVAVFFYLSLYVGLPFTLWVTVLLKEKLGRYFFQVLPQRRK